MGDLRTMLRRVRQDLQEPNITDSTKQEHDQAMLAMMDAILELQHEEFWFNVRNHSFATVNGQETYAISDDDSELPADLIAIIGDYIYIEINQNSETVWKLERVTNERYDYLQSAYTTGSTPLYWRFFNQLMWLLPEPTTTINNVKFRYLADLGSPSKRLNASNAWEFSPDTWGGSEIEQAWQEDNDGGPSYVDLTTDINDAGLADVSPFPDGSGDQDTLCLGFARPPTSLVIKTSTAGAGTYAVTWKYWNGTARMALDGVTDGSNGFQTAGRTRLSFTDPGTAFRKTVVNGSDLLYFLFAERDGGTVTTDPVLSQVEAVGNASPWTNEAERAVRFRTCYALCTGYLNDPNRGQAYLTRALEAMQDLKQRQADMQRTGQIEGYI